MKKKSLVTAIVSIAAIAAIGIGATFAYFTDKDAAKNVFTLGKIDIELEEPNWDPEDGRDVLPLEVISKDPTITVGKDSNDAYVFATVTLPRAELSVDGVKEVRDIFTLNNISEKWALIKVNQSDTQTEMVYAYTELVNPTAKTTPIFTSVSVVNFEEQNIISGQVEIDVDAYAVQTVGYEADFANADYAKIWNENFGE